MDLHVAESWFGEMRVVALTGVADLSSVPTLVAALTRVVREHGAGTIVADLDGLTVLDDVALGALLGASARAHEQGGSFSIVCSEPRIEHRIRETQLDRIIAVQPSLSAMRQSATDHPYVAVIFTNGRTAEDDAGYSAMAEQMEELAREQPGYRGIESVRGDDRVGITISYWSDDAAAQTWKQISEHLAAQAAGRDRWYEWYTVRVATVEREYSWRRPTTIVHLALPSDWATAQAAGTYAVSTRGVTLEQEGFIHCSCHHQVEGVANRFYADLDELVLLRVDPARLTADVVVEPPFSGAVEHFPHVYGPINLDAVVNETVWRRSGADMWRLPADF